jgi:hypothetical protein
MMTSVKRSISRKYVPFVLCLQRIPHGLPWNRTQNSEERWKSKTFTSLCKVLVYCCPTLTKTHMYQCLLVEIRNIKFIDTKRFATLTASLNNSHRNLICQHHNRLSVWYCTRRHTAKHGQNKTTKKKGSFLQSFVANVFTLVISRQQPKSRHPAVSCLLEDCANPNTLNLPQWPTAV